MLFACECIEGKKSIWIQFNWRVVTSWHAITCQKWNLSVKSLCFECGSGCFIRPSTYSRILHSISALRINYFQHDELVLTAERIFLINADFGLLMVVMKVGSWIISIRWYLYHESFWIKLIHNQNMNQLIKLTILRFNG